MDEAQIREYLAVNKIPQFVDQLIQQLVGQQPDDFKPILLEMLERHERSVGKGPQIREIVKAHKAGAPHKTMKYGGGDLFSDLGLENWNTPEHCRRDPRLKPSIYQVKRKGAVTWNETRSLISNPSGRKDYATTIAAQFNYAAAQCKTVCEAIQKKCVQENTPFFDEKFWYGERNAMYPKGAPADCTVTEPVEAMRQTELYPGAPIFASGVESNDIVQGAIGDCFFIGAVSALACCTAGHLDPLTRLIVFSDLKWGIYGTCWFKNGAWEWVITDDWISVSRDRQGQVWPQYASPATAAELWPLIIEKGYAKVHYCWDSIDGGWAREALEDLTGGLAYTLDLYRSDRTEWAGSFAKFKALCDDPLAILGCAVGNHVREVGGAGRAGESGAIFGLFKGHAYSLIKAQETKDGTGFVRVRNPWGNEAEWQGAYADRSPDWNRNPAHKRELNPEIKDDGAFWMRWDDFKGIFTDVDVMRFFPYEWVCFSLFGSAPQYDHADSNTFIINVKESASVVASLGQDDPKTHIDHSSRKKGRYAAMKLSVYRLSKLPSSYSELRDCMMDRTETKESADRTQFHEVDLEPGYYACVPKFRAANIGYYFRLFAPPKSHLEIFRFSDGPGKALCTEHGIVNAQDVPPVVIPSTVKIEESADESTVAAGGGDVNLGSLATKLGFGSAAEMEASLKEVWDEQDTYGRGKIDRSKMERALKKFVGACPAFTAKFDEIWAKYDTAGYGYYRMRMQDYEVLATQVLAMFYK